MDQSQTATGLAPLRSRAEGLVATLVGPDRYSVLLSLIIVAMISVGALHRTGLGPLLTTMLLGAMIMFALYTSRASHRLVKPMRAVILLALLVVFLASLIGSPQLAYHANIVLSGVLVLLAPFVIARRLTTHRTVDAETILGALSIYLLLGMFFAYLYGFLALAGMKPFFAQNSQETPVDFLYFSFVTLTTVGYGDLTPIHDLARMLAVSEALLGQFYLVTVIALLVARATVGRRSHDG